jgi:tripartite-type tricarboxylate transporter receptor subunit TctC
MSAVERALTLCAALCGGMLVLPAAADEVSDFYKGKTFTILVGHEVGTGFDIYARTLQRHLGRHIPGGPIVVVQNMTGASGISAANWLYNIAPKDGTVVATFVHTVPFEPLMGNSAARFEAAKFTWIGNMEESVAVCGVSKAAGIARFDEMREKEVIFGATGATGPLVKSALAVKNLLGVKMKVVSGYQGSASVKIAIGRGEVHGICGLPMSTITSFWRDECRAASRPSSRTSRTSTTMPRRMTTERCSASSSARRRSAASSCRRQRCRWCAGMRCARRSSTP